MEPRHVLQSTTYSKSVLRVAAEEATREFANVHYFASYEIISGVARTQPYFAEDRRSIRSEGVDHVMNCFFNLYGEDPETHKDVPEGVKAGTKTTSPMRHSEVVCDEEAFFRAVAETTEAKKI
jgi:hypothetical protein